jgi:hypothetical protein
MTSWWPNSVTCWSRGAMGHFTLSSEGSSMLNRRTSASCALEISDVSGSWHFSKAVSQAPWNNGCFLRCAHPTKNCIHDTPINLSANERYRTNTLQYSWCHM